MLTSRNFKTLNPTVYLKMSHTIISNYSTVVYIMHGYNLTCTYVTLYLYMVACTPITDTSPNKMLPNFPEPIPPIA